MSSKCKSCNRITHVENPVSSNEYSDPANDTDPNNIHITHVNGMTENPISDFDNIGYSPNLHNGTAITTGIVASGGSDRGIPSSGSYPASTYGACELPTVNTGSIHALGSDQPLKSLDQTIIPPAHSPTLSDMRSYNFCDTLVSIPDANVVKNLCKPTEVLADLECESCDSDPLHPRCDNPKVEIANDTEGSQLPFTWVDAKPVAKMTLLGRVGRFLARLKGEGVLWLESDGEVSVRKFLPFRTSHLWHKWYKPTPTSAPIIGNPMNYPYKVITDLDGNPFTVMGLPNEDSIEVFNHETKEFEARPVTDFPVCVSEQLDDSSTNFELVGFEALNPTDSSDLRRCLKKISGEGMLCLKKVPTAACDCEECQAIGAQTAETTVVEFIPHPTVESVLTHSGNAGECPVWSSTDNLSSLQGQPGQAGPQGEPGPRGANGVVTTYNDCCK